MSGIKDVARLAGVGVGTVSRVLNNTGYVAAATQRKIEQAMAQLDYHPNEMARNLFKNQTHIIGFIVPDAAHPFFGLIARYLEMSLYDRGYKMLICNTIQKSNRESEFLDMLHRHIMDGIIMGAHTLEVVEYGKTKEPVVGFDRILGSGIPCVASDHRKGGQLAAERFIADGRKNIVQLAGSRHITTPALEMNKQFAQTCAENGAVVHHIELPWNDFDFHSYQYLAEDIYTEFPHADGIFAAEMSAAACIEVYERHGARIPEDISVIGYDGTLISKIFPRRMTVIAQNGAALADKLADTVCRLIKKEQIVPSRITVDVCLKEGGTTLGRR